MEKILDSCHSEEMTVEKKDLAVNVGSGDLEVFATPSLIALIEKACMNCMKEFLKEEDTSVGISVTCEHLKASGEGAKVRAIICVKDATEKVVSFTAEVFEGDRLIGKGTHQRAVVSRDRFMYKVNSME